MGVKANNRRGGVLFQFNMMGTNNGPRKTLGMMSIDEDAESLTDSDSGSEGSGPRMTRNELWLKIRASWTDVVDANLVNKNLESQQRGGLISAPRFLNDLVRSEIEPGIRDLPRTVHLKRPPVLPPPPSKSSKPKPATHVLARSLIVSDVDEDAPSLIRNVLPIAPSMNIVSSTTVNNRNNKIAPSAVKLSVESHDTQQTEEMHETHQPLFGKQRSIRRRHHRRIPKKGPYSAHHVGFGAQEAPLLEEEIEDFHTITPLEVSDSAPSSPWWKHVRIKPLDGMGPGGHGRGMAMSQESFRRAMQTI